MPAEVDRRRRPRVLRLRGQVPRRGNTDLVVPADLPAEVAEQVRELACQAFEALSCEGLARVDFFVLADGVGRGQRGQHDARLHAVLDVPADVARERARLPRAGRPAGADGAAPRRPACTSTQPRARSRHRVRDRRPRGRSAARWPRRAASTAGHAGPRRSRPRPTVREDVRRRPLVEVPRRRRRPRRPRTSASARPGAATPQRSTTAGVAPRRGQRRVGRRCHAGPRPSTRRRGAASCSRAQGRAAAAAGDGRRRPAPASAPPQREPAQRRRRAQRRAAAVRGGRPGRSACG